MTDFTELEGLQRAALATAIMECMAANVPDNITSGEEGGQTASSLIYSRSPDTGEVTVASDYTVSSLAKVLVRGVEAWRGTGSPELIEQMRERAGDEFPALLSAAKRADEATARAERAEARVGELAADLERRADACTDLAQAQEKEPPPRLAGKAAAYRHAAELARQALESPNV